MDSTTSRIDELRGLMVLIGNAVDILEHDISQPKVASKEQPSDADLRSSVCTVEAACAQLCSLVARPGDVLANKFLAFYEPACLQVILSNKIPDILQEYPSGAHISELEKRTGISQGKLCRILRFLAAKHVFQEVGANTFANNHLSRELVSSNPLSSLGLCITNEMFKAGSSLGDVLNDPERRASTSPLDTAFSKYFGMKTLFDYYAVSSSEQNKLAFHFDKGMIGWGSVMEIDSLIPGIPWNTLPKGTSVCDVGGGVGNICINLAKHYPTWKFVLQDLPKPMDNAEKKIWPERCPEAIAENRIEFIPLDFLKGSPKEGCDIYYLKNILHSWSDEDCIKIIGNVTRAMGPSSRLFVHEFVVRPGYRIPKEEARFVQAPEPLLPNFGEGRIRQYSMDINMMALFNSAERTLDDFIQLGQSAGLKFVKLWETGELGIVEFVQQHH
ncbi:hypothetical protein AGABI2DRAFT_117544 [Agaricus bisporus var. bisporus H97]|uniref:hypothetical protein n=1 Tax=Agaricus bisporus var. bisporus (strain H97 / ATCC MYA-4626 / FGSC 10389) TaxID=936046 RepID=UPI00029F4EF8|nr:hypothetical protein AGABI2DRAFT_117544 [Agaricus bisporus var. bisporus H97]EKV48743.1 hypothetical protein AGABI2DRAFT_117544 [Agaricus bisporus var. bisporus H97]